MQNVVADYWNLIIFIHVYPLKDFKVSRVTLGLVTTQVFDGVLIKLCSTSSSTK